ncbi:MAG TPA: AAA family ATPase [Pseudomonadota bacterium]|nr:AAA family ATPase [Pseudomonadota bacterium]
MTDVNPSNLFLPGGDLGRVKLLDFGIARRSANPVTQTGLVIGTPEYMAPEQVRGQRDLTPAADIFSLGGVFYKCLTGKPAFGAEQLAALLVRILFEEPVALRERLPGVPEAVVELLRRMLHKDPAHRFADAGELAVALASLGELPELPAAAVDAPPPSPFAKSEQVLYTLVAASLVPLESVAFEQTQGAEAPPERELVSALRTLGLRADFVVGGLLVVTIPPRASATDQVALAARVALLIKERWPAAVVAVATGRGAAHGGATVGEVVDRAAAMLRREEQPSQASPAGIFLDELTARLVTGRFEVITVSATERRLGEAKDADASRPLLGKPTPCVGRDAELAVLEGQLLSCIEDSEARAVIVTALPGIGKSRLRHEFLRRLEKLETRPAVWLARGDLMSTSSPYGILGDAIRRLSGLTGSEPLEVQRSKLRARLGQHLRTTERTDAERVILFVAELCGVPFPEEEHPMLAAARQDPKILRDRIRRAFLDWLAAECAVAPVLLVIDDLHLGDALSVALIDEALRELAGAPLCVLALARPELYQSLPRLWHGRKLQEIQLKGLARKPCERLIQQMLGKQVAPAVVARLIEQSAGNALFLEETMRPSNR